MTVSEIYELVNYISNKNKSGNAFNIDRYNKILEAMDPDFFKRKIEEFELYRRSGEPPPNQAMFSSKLLRTLKTIDEVAVGGNNRIDVTELTRFAYAIGILGFRGGRYWDIEFVSDEEYDNRRSDTVLSTDNSPIATMAEDYIYINWGGVAAGPVEMTYYSFPETPFCDYYLDVNGVIQFLDAEATHVWVAGETDSGGTAHILGDPDWDSLTVELAYEIDMHWEFMMSLLGAVGIKLEQPMITQYAEAMKAEAKQL